MIGFFVTNKKLRFEINISVAERAKINMSSRILLLAKIVKDGRANREQ